MHLYPYQTEIIDALHSGKNIVRAGSRRVGLTTAALIYIKEKVERTEFRARIHARSERDLIALIDYHNLPIVTWPQAHGLDVHVTVHVASTPTPPTVCFDLYDNVNLPAQRMSNQWALISTHGICRIPGPIHEPFYFMEGVSYMDVPHSPTPN
jgi:hypothetical protein